MYQNVIRWWLTGILILVPFQYKIRKTVLDGHERLSNLIGYADEITIVVFLLFAIREFYKNRETFDRSYLILLIPIFIFTFSGLISGIVNSNKLMITILGSFDYIKNFLVIFIYSAFFREFSKLKRIFNLLLIVAVLIGVVALLQELWAMTSRYILQKDFDDMAGFFLGRKVITGVSWRFGIFRANSLMHNSNIMGLYCLLIFTIYLFTVRKVNFALLLSFVSGIFFSVSRIVYAGFVFVVGAQIFRRKGRKLLVVLAMIPIVILLFYMSTLPDFNVLELLNIPEFTKERYLAKKVPYRVYTRDKASEIWKDHPFWGIGPGMYGGIISIKFRSPIYNEYNFYPNAMKTLTAWQSIDIFWPQVLAEMGIIGSVSFAGLVIALFGILFICRQRATFYEMKGLFTGLAAYTMVILIYSMGSGLNITSIIFTYSAFVGMGLGCKGASQEENDKINPSCR